MRSAIVSPAKAGTRAPARGARTAERRLLEAVERAGPIRVLPFERSFVVPEVISKPSKRPHRPAKVALALERGVDDTDRWCHPQDVWQLVPRSVLIGDVERDAMAAASQVGHDAVEMSEETEGVEREQDSHGP